MTKRGYNYNRLTPRCVEIEDTETGKIDLFPSIYAAAKAYNIDPKTLWFFNEKIWREKYKIKIGKKIDLKKTINFLDI